MQLLDYLNKQEIRIVNFLKENKMDMYVRPQHMFKAIICYTERSAKRLRPSVLLIAAGCVGGAEAETRAFPAAVGVELFHTWTLVHDDLIDHDSMRRGGPTVHKLIESIVTTEGEIRDKDSIRDYANAIAILAGDMQHGLSIEMFVKAAKLSRSINPMVILEIISNLEKNVLSNLIYGETLDVQYGLKTLKNLTYLTEDDIVNMLWLKTGVLYEFSAMTGIMIGKNTPDIHDPHIVAMKNFAKNCGIAFQLQDDILGIIGNEEILGKPVGSDIREGKKTTIVLKALTNASESQYDFILGVLGNKEATPDAINTVTKMFRDLNGIQYTQNLAHEYIEKALPFLDCFEESYYKRLLHEWADIMINRKF